MASENRTFCDAHALVVRETEDCAHWREQHEMDDHEFRDWIRNEFALIRQCIDEKITDQTNKRREDISRLNDKMDGLKTLMLTAAIGALAGLLGTVVTLVIVIINKG